jgi:hypothetical protein
MLIPWVPELEWGGETFRLILWMIELFSSAFAINCPPIDQKFLHILSFTISEI